MDVDGTETPSELFTWFVLPCIVFTIDRKHAHAVLCRFSVRVVDVWIIGLTMSPIKKDLRRPICVHERQLVDFVEHANECSGVVPTSI